MNLFSSKASIVPAMHLAAREHKPSALARLGRMLLFAQLRQLQHGELVFIDEQGTHRFGHRDAACELSATVHVTHSQLYADAAFGGSVGAGEAYIKGYWRCDDLVSLVRLFVLNREVLNGMDRRWSIVRAPLLKLFHLLNRNSRAGSARNIAAHYDIGNELYELMLDETMAYSCGIFDNSQSSLREASIAKFDIACRKLNLQAGDHLLEIGTGWGGLALHAAQRYGCRVTTTTISQEQFKLAKQKIAAAGLDQRITVLLQDYRDVQPPPGKFDKLVSIEMIEAVGHQYLDVYLQRCSELLKPNGAMLLQAITIRDHLYADALKSVDYIQRFIFPGSFIPCVAAITQSLSRVTDLTVFHLEDIGPHYATTLRNWRERFMSQLSAVRQLGYSEAFIRLWEFYLCYCEGGFAERQLGTVQMLLTKPQFRDPVSRTGGHV